MTRKKERKKREWCKRKKEGRLNGKGREIQRGREEQGKEERQREKYVKTEGEKGENRQRNKKRNRGKEERERQMYTGRESTEERGEKSDKGWVALEGRHTLYPGTLRHAVATRTN